MIESSALKAYQRAFASFGIIIQRGSTHSKNGAAVPDQEVAQYVVGKWPTPGLGKSFLLTNTSNLYYFTALLDGQESLITAPSSSFSPPSWPPTAQNIAAFQAVMQTIGNGIGNGAAHETGHHLEQMRPPMGGIFHDNRQFPYMDCGISNPDRMGAIRCQDGNNFVYGFYNSNGLPQDPNKESSGNGSFFYVDIPGHPIHWGPDSVCWLVNWTGPGTCEF